MIPQRESPLAERFLYLVCSEPTLEPLYENTAHTGDSGENERAAKGSQLTRVVPPNFSVPFGESKCSAFLFPNRGFRFQYINIGARALAKGKRRRAIWQNRN